MAVTTKSYPHEAWVMPTRGTHGGSWHQCPCFSPSFVITPLLLVFALGVALPILALVNAKASKEYIRMTSCMDHLMPTDMKSNEDQRESFLDSFFCNSCCNAVTVDCTWRSLALYPSLAWERKRERFVSCWCIIVHESSNGNCTISTITIKSHCFLQNLWLLK